MNRRMRLFVPMLIAMLAGALALGVSTASAVTLTPTTAPLAGSNFQGGDGNEANPVGDVSQPPDGVNDIDWQAISGTPGAIDTTNPDMAFSGGDKESDPGKWAFADEGSGINPSKDNLLGAWSTSAPNVSGPPSTFLYLAYTREAQTGNTFNTFELNQLAETWNNGNANITCRTTGDLLISYEVASGGAPPNVDILVYRWIADTSDAVTGCSKTGHFQEIDPQPNAEAGVNGATITNFLSTGTFGNTFLQGTFGEAALNLTAILSGANLNPCQNFGQISMHTRSSTSIDSQLQDYISPVPVIVRSCSLAIKKTGSSPHHDGDPETFTYEVTNDGTVAVTVSKASNTGVTDDKCGPVTYVSGDTNNDGKVDLTEKWVFTCSYTVKHSDENASHDIINTATVHGTVGSTPITRSTTYTTHVIHPAIDVTKTAAETAVHVGDTIHYTVTVKNTGDTSLTVTPADTGCTGFNSASFTLAAGASKQLTCTHTVTAGDGTHYDNQACAQGVDAIGGADGTVSDCDHVNVPILHPGIAVTKTAGETAAHVGDTIHYTIKVTNTGDTALTVSPSDIGCTGFDNSSFSLAAGASKTLTCTHQATAGDGTAKANEACAQGVDSIGGAKGTVSDCDTVTTDVIHPAIQIDKTERIAGHQPPYVDGPITAFVGDMLEYEMTVTNSGDTPLSVTFTDGRCDAATLTGPTGDTNQDGKLDPSETWVYRCSHLLTNPDKPSFTNTAHVDGTDKLGQTVSDEDSVVATTADFKISGHKFEDQNANGTKDAGEPGISGWTFYLDANNNGQLDQGETSVKTDANGSYQFAGLNPGSYVVREIVPSGWHCSTPSPCEYHFTLSAGDPDRTNADFGNWHDSTVAGTKFHDRNANGARDAGEEGLGGWTFYVDYNGNGVRDGGEPSAQSAGDGGYKISGIKPGTFAVREVGQAGWTCSFPASCEHDLTFRSNDAKTGADFGNWEPASVSGTKFEDTNNNGVHDAGEGPLPGFTLYVDYNGNGSLDAGEPSAVSGADGTWTINGIKPGTFNVREVADPNYTCTFPGAGDACKYQVALQAGDAQTGKDFGNAPPAQIIATERATPGSARLLGPSGCAAKAFTARVRGTKVKTVTFVLDGKMIKRFTKTKKSGIYPVRINPQKMQIGVHRLVVSVTFQKGSGTKAKKLRLSFQRCARKLAVPRFTG